MTGQNGDVEVDPQNTILDLKVSRRVQRVDPDINRTKWVELGRVETYPEWNVEND